MKRKNIHTAESLSFIINIVFAVYNCVLGMASYSWWFTAVGAYYVILSTMRVSVAVFSAKSRKNEAFIMRFSGLMIFVMAIVLCGTVYMAVFVEEAAKYHEITMITIALYAFTKLTLAILGFVKSGRNNSPHIRTLRSISLADAVVSIYSLQRSMLVSFDGMSANDIALFNMISGVGMCVIVVFTGLNLIFGKDGKNGEINDC